MITFVIAPVTLYPSADSMFPQSAPTLAYVTGPTLARKKKRPTKPQTEDVEPIVGGCEKRKQRERMLARATIRCAMASAAWRVLRREKSATAGRLASELGTTRKMVSLAVRPFIDAGTVVKMRRDNFRRDHTTHTIYALADAATQRT
jgi:hypothetical protein